jgi:acyl-CoA synthetase (AMP-forming)/AMP-acid ligase II
MVKVPSLDEALVRWARLQPDAAFVTETGAGTTISYGATLRAVRGVQRLLGLAPRTIVLALPSGVAAAVVWLAALGAGHRLVLCPPEAADREKARLATRYRPDVLVARSTDAAEGFGRSGRSVVTPEQLQVAFSDGTDSASSPGDTGVQGSSFEGQVCLTTSGTTGTPKGVTLQAHQIAWTAQQVRLSHRLTPNDRGLTMLPFSHINAPVVSLSATLLAGASVVVAPRFSRSGFWEWIESDQVTWASVVPTIIAVLLQTEKPDWLPGRLRFIRTAAAPLPAFYLRAFETRFGIPVIETYGLSEAASQVAANPVPPGRHRAGTVGFPTGVEMRICEPAEVGQAGRLRDVVPGAEGEICIAGPAVIARYDGGESREEFVDGWFRTGDLGSIDGDGYLHVTGRIRDVINRGGEKISPREVEDVLLAHPDILDVVVAGEPDPIYGQRAVAYVVPRRPVGQDLERRLLAYASRLLTAFKVPSAVVQVEALPRTHTGKIRRHQIAVEYAAAQTRDSQKVA